MGSLMLIIASILLIDAGKLLERSRASYITKNSKMIAAYIEISLGAFIIVVAIGYFQKMHGC